MLAWITSALEIITAILIVVLLQALVNPTIIGERLIHYTGLDFPKTNILIVCALFVGCAYVVKNIFIAFEVWVQNTTIQSMNHDFKNKALKHYAEISYAKYMTMNSSDAVQLINFNIDQMFSVGLMSLATIISEALIFCGLTGVVIFVNPKAAIFSFVVIIGVVFIVIRILSPHAQRAGLSLNNAATTISKLLTEFFGVFKEIIIMGKKDYFIDRVSAHSKIRCEMQAMVSIMAMYPRLILETLFVGIFVVMIVFMSAQNKESTQMLGMLGSYAYAGFRIMPGLNRIISMVTNFKAVVPSIEAVYREIK